MRGLAKHIIIRMLLLSAILIASAYIYQNYLYRNDLLNQSPIVEDIQNISSNLDVLYLGESSNMMYDEADQDKRLISEMLNTELPNRTVESLNQEASHSGIYKVLLSAIPKNKKIKMVIVTLNLRSFGSAWIHSKLETPLQKELVMLKNEPPILKRFYLSFKAFDNKRDDVRRHDMLNKWSKDQLKFPYSFPYSTVSEWDESVASKGEIVNGKIDAKTDLACSYIKAYGFQIDTLTNPRIADFDEIIHLAEDRGWKLIFNLLPENIERAKELVGKDLIFLMEQNRDLLVNYFSRKGVTVVDNLELVENQYFIDQNWTTEHYTEEGRLRIALRLKQAIEKTHGYTE